MLITKEDKAKEVASLAANFGRAKASFLVDFKGMTVEQVTTLRKRLHPLDAEMSVVRNTLARRALAGHPKTEAALKDGFLGNNAVVFAFGDAGATAKALNDFSKEVESLQLKIGEMEGNALSAVSVKALANLPSKDVLRAMLLGTFQAAASKFVRTLAAYQEKLEKDSGAAPAAATEPAAT
jgi:large subunit ribosomal protein L10